MKIRKIELKGYNQFENVTLDLTFPQGHPKAGLPLDKVCFIGQSGTGKTSLLRLIKWFVSLKREIGKNVSLMLPPAESVRMDFRFFDLSYSMSNVEDDPFLRYHWEKKYDSEGFFRALGDHYRKVKPVLINFPTEILTAPGYKTPAARIDPADELERIKVQQTPPGVSEPQRIIDFGVDDVDEYWESIVESISDHRARELLIKNKVADAAIGKNGENGKDKEQSSVEYRKWLKENPDPLAILADQCLDPVLFDLGLKTKREIDLQAIRNLGFIALQTIAGQDVPRDFWSTGTRQLVQTIIPLFQLKPGNAVILIDEPECSLFPDVQRNIIQQYVTLAPDSQFFFATHSPLIASSFDPWEVVELKFDGEHKSVSRELYFDGENHIDNYKYYPRYLRWDSILQRVFDLAEEGSEQRVQALEEWTELKARIEDLKQQNKLDSPEGKKLVDQYLALSHKLDWRTGEHDS